MKYRNNILALFIFLFAGQVSAQTTTATFSYSGSIVNWSVPAGVTSITIDAYGAQGGNNLWYTVGGYGARTYGTFAVTSGQVLKILVGGQGGSGYVGGGGGGSFVTNTSNTPLCIAGGGGGAYYYNYSCGSGNSAGTTSTTGQSGIYYPNFYCYAACGGGGGPWGGGAQCYVTGVGGGGGGLTYDGSTGGYAAGGTSFANGGWGGAGYGSGGNGGFGGGGGGDWYWNTGGGGGGGYGGGSGGEYYGCGGGGSSYNAGTGQVNQSGVQVGNGVIYITYNSCSGPASPSPSTFGSSTWNVYCYTGGNLNLSGCSYAGYYTEASLSYDSQSKWSNLGTPSSAPGYSGCAIAVDYHTVIYKRQDFPCGKYQLDIPAHDDDIRVYVNGTQVFEHVGCCDVHTNIWTGYLSTGSTIEVRHAEFTGGSQQALTVTNVTPAIVNGSLTINGVAANTNICVGSTITVTQGTGGSFPEASYYYWLGSENPAGSGWVTAWAIWNGSYQNTANPPSPPAFTTPGRYVVHTNAINNTCGWAYYGAGTTRYVDVLAAPTAPTSATASPASICLGSTSTLTTTGGLAAYYTFNNTLNDASGNGLTLTGSGGTLSASGLQLTTASSYASVSTEILNTDKYTIDFYMQYTATFDGIWRKIFGFTPAGTDRSPGIWKYPSSMQMHWRHDPGNTGLTEAKVYTQGQWYHVVGEKNGGTLTIYVDGVQVDQGSVANPKTAGQATLWFGGAPVLLKEFKIYNGIFRWYTGSCGGTLVGSGPSIAVSPASTTTYYVREEGECGSTSCASVSLTVTMPVSANSGGPDQYVCTANTSITMAASGAGTWTQIAGPNTPNIVNAASGTTQIGTTTALITGTYVFRWTVGCGYDDVTIVKQ